MKDIIDQAREINETLEREFVCPFCSTAFRREQTLAVHMCEPKRRSQEQNEVGVQLGFQSYRRFYELEQGGTANITYDNFASSKLYKGFVKFGRHVVQLRAVAVNQFIDFVIKKREPLDNWCKDSVYEEFLYKHLRHENPIDALERGIKEMDRWADENKSQFNHFFRYGSPNRIVYMICTGRISPWVLYNCKTGKEFLSKLNEEHLEMVYYWIEPEYWKRQMKNHLADTEYCRKILLEAGM